jgi:hypothetical protein
VASEALSLTWVSGRFPRGSCSGNGVLGPGPAQRQQLLTQVLSSARRQGEESERKRGRGQQEGGRRENAEVLKGTLTSFLGFPWQPNIPQMISV